MAAILEFDPAVGNAIRAALGMSAVLLTDAAQVARHLGSGDDPVLVIGPSVEAAVALRLTENISASHPGAGVIWLRRRVDTATVLEAIRAGASDVVDESDLNALVAAARRVTARAHAWSTANDPESEVAAHGKVTAVYASKGGCGKTTIATNLAALIATEQHSRVLVVDLDLESGDVQLHMALPPTLSICDLTDAPIDRIDAEALNAVTLEHVSGAFVLAAPRRPESAAAVSTVLVNRVLAVARTMFDHVIVDCPPYITDHVLAVLDVADRVVLVCTPDAACVKNTAIALETMSELSLNAEISLFINHAGESVGITSRDIARVLGFTTFWETPASLDVIATTNRGMLMATSRPGHPVVCAIRTWVMAQAAEVSVPDAAAAKPVKGKRFVLRRKRVVAV